MQDERLADLYATYRSAYLAAQVRRASEAAVDRLLRTRVALFEYLVDTGWLPPEMVARQVASDRSMLCLIDDVPILADRIDYLEAAGTGGRADL